MDAATIASPVIRPRTIFLLFATIALSGCATTARDPLAARKKAYERLASFLEPGMTRRQVYALLPPQRPPTTWGPGSVFALPISPFLNQVEFHPLDPAFRLRLSYTLANPE